MGRDQAAGAAVVVHEKLKLFMGVLALQFLLAGFHIVTRAALNMGISKIVFIVYRNLISLVLLAPFAYFLEKKDRPPLTFSLLVEFFLLALCGITANQGFYLLGLYHLSPTYASAIQNTVPAITFAMAAVLRLEQVDLSRRHGLAKVVGTVVSIGGATVITLMNYVERATSTPSIAISVLQTLYKGLPLFHYNLHIKSLVSLSSSSPILNWTLGCVFILGNCLSWSGWMVLQGLVASGVAFALQIWCIDRGGPLFTAVFQPVQTVAVAAMAAVILGDQLYTGGIIGAVLIVIGLYFVLWGKSEEKKTRNQDSAQGGDMTRHLLGQDASADDQEVPTADLA